jgi:23S rRNA (cytosine1962-C5)-methyltransferase
VSGGYALLDLGAGARLERFGDRVVERPHPAATGRRGDPAVWRTADLRWERDGGWLGDAAARRPWTIDIDELTLELRPTVAGQVGLFPEHAAMLPWLRERANAILARVGDRGDRGDRGDDHAAVLNLFAATGHATLSLAGSGVTVVHVDSSRPTVAWARRNAEHSGLAGAAIRWIVDDVRVFAEREVRRGRRYAGILLDPPSYGHGPRSGAWHIDRDLPALLATCSRLLAPGGFVLLTAHTEAFAGARLAGELAASIGRSRSSVEAGRLSVTTADGRRLELGAFARWPGTA